MKVENRKLTVKKTSCGLGFDREIAGKRCRWEGGLESVGSRVDAERAELDLLLSCKKFARTNNLGRFLGFVCDKYFEGAASEIKEYSIGVEALGRTSEFDPQVDCIVRVTAHNLRKQLETYYATDGASHVVHICLPSGHYVPQFVHREELGSRLQDSLGSSTDEIDSLGHANGHSSSAAQSNGKQAARVDADGSVFVASKPRWRNKIAAPAVVSALLLLLFAGFLWVRSSRPKSPLLGSALAAPGNVSGAGIHALVGDDLKQYIDRIGLSWQSDRFCSGGNSFSAATHTILGTEDGPLFQYGRRGVFQCNYPVPPGTYEVHLLFAETSQLQEASRNVAFTINGGPVQNLDVMDDAGGDDVATTKIYTDVRPDNDGMIHVAFTTPESFVNAIEISPGNPDHMLPVRIVVGHTPYRDAEGNLWLSDRYYSGGRLSRFGGELPRMSNSAIYEWHRFGHFHYIIPVATSEKYTLRLHFLEHWFGVQNGGTGGAGSRIFDVSCNGSMLLKDFDIYREAGPEPLVKIFPHIQPTAQGKIELYFTPVVNYPSISAIEILPE